VTTMAKRTDLELVTHALHCVLDELECLDADDLDEEDKALIDFCRRTCVASENGDLSAIHAECDFAESA
jgi:hypothetical protein